MLAIAAACLGLMPEQPVWILGLELVFGALLVWVIEARSTYLIVRDDTSVAARLLKTGIGIVPLGVFSVGALLLLLGNADGSYGVAIGSILALVGAVLFSWVALIERRR